ncbi:MAG TPA: hypothetical protein VHZ06_00200 [Marmoricola sp.]|nr:hypothetical protein [Marmoricola sp.]
MTPKTLVIHAGTYKTGSSAIQLYLARADHDHQLGDAVYSATGRSLGVAHGNLTADLRGGLSFVSSRGGWDKLLADIVTGEAATTVVSSENFTNLDADQLAEIGARTRAAGVDVRWVHYVREQAGFYNAFYVERLVSMRPEYAHLVDLPFEEFGTWSPIDLSLMNYASFADKVVASIPGVDLRLRPFARGALLDGDVVADFCETAGIKHTAEHAEVTNVGTGWRTVETARRLSPLIKKAQLGERTRGMKHGRATRMRWIALVRSELVAVTDELGWNEESAVYLTPEFRERLLDRYAGENRRVAELGGFDWPAIVAAEEPKERNIGDFDEISSSELSYVVQRVVGAMLQPPAEIAELLVPRPPKTAKRSTVRRAAGYARRKLR